MSCMGSYSGCMGTPVMVPSTPTTTTPTTPAKVMPETKKTSLPQAATIVVQVPVEAKVTIDGASTSSTSSVRSFVTPELEQGKVFHYTLKAEVVRNGKTYLATERVAVKAGETTSIELDPKEIPVLASK